jgi:pyruvate kinase
LLRGGPLADNDERFLKLAIEQRVDYIALTYVADASDILMVRERLLDLGRDIPIIAKIERSEAFARLDGILKRADAVMIRRGDLGAHIEVTRIPLVQKEILRLANNSGVPVIIATQMLGSMIESPSPTRAEASDVSNAIADGADGVLLSAETATGKYPVEAVAMMGRIISETERSRVTTQRPLLSDTVLPFEEATAAIACQASIQCNAKLIACFTESGTTASLLAKYRPQAPIIAFCTKDETRRKLALTWGIRTDELEPSRDVEVMVSEVEKRLVERGLLRPTDRLVIAFGAPVGESGHTNSVRLHEVG